MQTIISIVQHGGSPLAVVMAVGDLALNVAMDASMVVGAGEGLRAAYIGLHAAEDVGEHLAVEGVAHAAEGAAEHEATEAAERGAEEATTDALESGGRADELGSKGEVLDNPRGRENVRVWRAVLDDERADLEATGEFRNPENLGRENKYFSLTKEGAERYARGAYGKFNDFSHYTLTSGRFPRALITDGMLHSVDRGIPALIIPNGLLPEVRDIRILHFII